MVFGSGSFYRLLGPPKPQKPRGKQKKTKGFSGMSGPRILFRGIGFFGFLGFFGFPRVFLIFRSGSFYRLLGPPITQEPRGKPKKTEKKHSVLRNVWAPFFRCSDVLRVFLFFCFVVFLFLVFGCGSRPQKINLFSFKPYHPLICLQLVFCFVQCFV